MRTSSARRAAIVLAYLGIAVLVACASDVKIASVHCTVAASHSHAARTAAVGAAAGAAVTKAPTKAPPATPATATTVPDTIPVACLVTYSVNGAIATDTKGDTIIDNK